MRVNVRPDLVSEGLSVIGNGRFFATPEEIASARYLGSDDVTGEVILEVTIKKIVRVDSIDLDFVEED